MLKEGLAVKTAWCGVLRRNLGISRWKKLSATATELGGRVAELTETASNGLQAALEEAETRLLSSGSLQRAKESFEQLSNEVKERVRQGTEEIARKCSKIVLEEEDEEGTRLTQEVDGNSNEPKS